MTKETVKVTVSNEKVLTFRRAYEAYINNHPGQFRKFLYTLNKVYNRIKPIEDEFKDAERLIEIEHAAKDTKGFADMDKFTVERRGEKKEEERFKFTLDAQKEVQKAKRKLLDATQEVDVFHTDDIPDDLGFDWYGLFAPFVFPEDPTEEQLDKMYKFTEDKQKKAAEEQMAIKR